MTSASIQENLQAGIRCHDAGDIQQAERFYREVLRAEPRHAQATYLMGLLAHQVGKHDLAVQLMSDAIRLDGGQPTFHCALGEAYRRLGKVPEAVTSYRQALRLNPNIPDAYNNLGTLFQAQGDLSTAVDHYRRAIALKPDYGEAYHNLGLALQQQGQVEAALAAFAESSRLKPDDLGSRLAHASLLHAQGKFSEAQAHFEELSQRHPNSAQVQCALGAGHQALGDYETATACYRRAIELDPNHAEAYYNLGTALHRADRDLEAIEAYQAATLANPLMAPAWSNLANTCVGLMRPDEAALAARQAVAIQPRSNKALGNLAIALQLQGDMDGAIESFRRCIEVSPSDAGNHSNLLYTLNFHPGYDDATLFAEHRAWAQRHADPLTAAAAPHENDRDPNRRLRVGYVSSHFRHQAVAFFSEPLLTAHDPQQVELYCYADLPRADEITERFRARADVWRDTTQLSDDQLAELVRQDRIDILVDLAGHIGGNRLLAFARKPAPVQVTYLGYQNTTGMTAMDYRLTDSHADPPGTDRWYTERLVRLPRYFFCYAAADRSPPVGPPPMEKNGYVTFASLNNTPKLRPEQFRVWAQILSRIPDSRLLVLAYSPGVLERNVRALLADEGIDSARIEVVNKRPRYDYLELHNEIDVALDTFPFNGHTTVCDALWMGVPSIMLEGGSYASRFGGSTLLGVGLGELICHTVDEYIDVAVRLAGDRGRLAEMRRILRERLADSPLFDAPLFAQDVEAAYRQMWQTWCAS